MRWTSRFREFLQKGVDHLLGIVWFVEEGYMNEKSNLIANGTLRSSTHILAIMYAGELLFWSWEAIAKESTDEKAVTKDTEKKSRERAKRVLKVYISIVTDDPMLRLSFSVQRAEELVAALEEMEK
eukprot:UC4_evm1s696